MAREVLSGGGQMPCATPSPSTLVRASWPGRVDSGVRRLRGTCASRLSAALLLADGVGARGWRWVARPTCSLFAPTRATFVQMGGCAWRVHATARRVGS